MRRIVAVVPLLVVLAGCAGDRDVREAERSVEEDADRLAGVLEPLCQRQPTCPNYLPEALRRSLDEGNEVLFYEGRQFEVRLCVVNAEHDVWAWYASENVPEVRRGGKPCEFS